MFFSSVKTSYTRSCSLLVIMQITIYTWNLYFRIVCECLESLLQKQPHVSNLVSKTSVKRCKRPSGHCYTYLPFQGGYTVSVLICTSFPVFYISSTCASMLYRAGIIGVFYINIFLTYWRYHRYPIEYVHDTSVLLFIWFVSRHELFIFVRDSWNCSKADFQF